MMLVSWKLWRPINYYNSLTAWPAAFSDFSNAMNLLLPNFTIKYKVKNVCFKFCNLSFNVATANIPAYRIQKYTPFEN